MVEENHRTVVGTVYLLFLENVSLCHRSRRGLYFELDANSSVASTHSYTATNSRFVVDNDPRTYDRIQRHVRIGLTGVDAECKISLERRGHSTL